MARGFERPPRWAIIFMTVAAVAVVVLWPLTARKAGQEPSAADVETAPAPAAEDTSARNDSTNILVIGDSYTAGSSEGGKGEGGWATLAAQRLDENDYWVNMDVSASGGCGYVQRGPEDVIFEDLVNRETVIPYDVVVFLGSRNDRLDKGDIQGAAASAYAAALRNSPEAALLVIGPPWVDEGPPAWVEDNRDAVAAAAKSVGATFVDPLANGWFTGEAVAFIGSDGVHPTDEGQRYMADLVTPEIERVIDQLPAA